MKKTFREAVVAIIENNKAQILIGYSPRDKSYKLPQGGIDPGETARDTVKRELIEELNYHLNENDIISVFSNPVQYTYPTPTTNHLGQNLIVIHIKHHQNTKFSPQDDEFSEMIWINPEELKNYDTDFRNDAYNDALKLCQLI